MKQLVLQHDKNPITTPACLLRCLIFTASICPALAWACEPYTDNAAKDSQLTVGSVQVRINDVFNNELAAENQLIHQLANRLHIQSRKELIESQLLFTTGQAFDPSVLAETARNLRRNRYLRSASVTPMQICEGEVDILVETGDNWSLIPGFNFTRAGGENEFAFSLSELNLLGLGKSLELALDYGVDRDQQVLRYHDPMLFGSKTQFTLQFQNNTDGNVQAFEFKQPFASLDTRTSWGVRAGNTEFVKSLYDDGFLANQVAVDREYAAIQIGKSNGRKLVYRRADDQAVYRIVRMRTGWQYDRLQLDATNRFPTNDPEAERIYSYPFFELDLLQPQFIEQSNLQLMESVEDIDVGHRLRGRVGWATESLGSSTDALVTEFDYSKGWMKGDRFLSLLKTSANGYFGEDGLENGIASASVKQFYFATRRSRFFASANVISTAKLYENQQVVLGGATGLRGYPLNFQTGSRRARLTLEHRYFFDWYPLRLARVGTAVFADMGSAWDKGEDPQWLRDVGVGLRIVGTRQADAKVMHIDLAMPLDETDQIDRFQFVVTAKTQF